MTAEAQIEQLENSEIGKTSRQICREMVATIESMDASRKDAINSHMLSKLAGASDLDDTVLPTPSWKGNYIHRIFAIKGQINILIGYPDEFLKLEHSSEKLKRKITFYFLDLHILRERLKKLSFDASHLVKAGVDPRTIWKGGERTGGPCGKIRTVLNESFKGVSQIRNSMTHDWDYSDDDLDRLSSLEQFSKGSPAANPLGSEKNFLDEEHKLLFEA